MTKTNKYKVSYVLLKYILQENGFCKVIDSDISANLVISYNQEETIQQ